MKYASFLAGLAVTCSLGACTTEQAYNSLKGYQQNECNKRVDNQDRERCLRDADTSYDEYRKQTAQ